MSKTGENNDRKNLRLYESLIYKKLIEWSDPALLIEQITRMKKAEGDYKMELFKNYRKVDFLTTYIIICELGSQHLTNPINKEQFIQNILGSVIGRLIFETSDIKDINQFLKDFAERNPNALRRWLKNRRKGAVWVLDTFLENTIRDSLSKRHSIIEGIPEDWNLSYEEYAKYEFSTAFGASYTDVQSILSRGVSRTSLCNLLYNFIMIRRLMEGLGNKLFLTWYGEGDLFVGSSGIRRFFDGAIVIEEEDKQNPWLLKCVSNCHNPLDAIESVESELVDIGMNKCILFMPMYPSQMALRYAVYSFAEKKMKISMLYLHDLYNILRINSCYVPAYLKEKMIG